MNAPVCDNPSGMYCKECRATGVYHCAHPEECGGMKPMAPVDPAWEKAWDDQSPQRGS